MVSENGPFNVGGCLVERGLDRISRGSVVVTVRPQVMDVLVYLASRGGETIHTDELLEDLWPDKVVTSASVYNCITELRHALQDCDDSQSYIETVPKRGYRFVAAVTGLDESKLASGRTVAVRSSRRVAVIVISILAIAVSIPAYKKWWVTDAPSRSVAVLPFVNLSPDPEDRYLADGLAEELLNSLARNTGLTVTARTSSFSFKNGTADIREIASQLGVANVVEGSVRVNGDTMRVTAQLIEAESGSQIWSDTFDRNVADLLVVRNEISKSIISVLVTEPEIPNKFMSQTSGTSSPEAYADYLRANALLRQWNYDDREEVDAAIAALKQATILDPMFARAYAALGLAYYDLWQWHIIQVPFDRLASERTMDLALMYCDKALEIEPSLSAAYRIKASIVDDWDESIRLVRKSLESDPNDAESLIYGGWWLAISGEAEEGIELIRKGFLLDPLNPEAVGEMVYVAAVDGDLKKASYYQQLENALRKTRDRSMSELKNWRDWVDSLPRQPGNLDYEAGIDNWNVGSNCIPAHGTFESTDSYSGKFSGHIASSSLDRSCFIFQGLSARDFRNKYVRLTGMIKSRDIEDQAYFRINVFDSNSVLISTASTWPRYIIDDTEWTEYEASVYVPVDGYFMNFGTMMLSSGKIWVDDFSMVVSNSPSFDTLVMRRPASTGAPDGWVLTGNAVNHYEIGVADGMRDSPVAYVRSIADDSGGFGALMQKISAADYRGGQLTLSGMVRTRDVKAWAGLWMRIDGAAGEVLSIDNMRKRPISNTTDWGRYEIVMDVPENAEAIAFGALLAGTGELYVDDFRLDTTRQDKPACASEASNIPCEPTNLSFED